MKDDLSLDDIPSTLLEVSGKHRMKWLWFREDNPISKNDFIYVPLYQRLEAKALDESNLPEVLRIPVAVYKKSDWRNRRYIEYEYRGDDVK